MLRWYSWLCEMKKKDEEKRMEVEHQKLASRLIKRDEGGTGRLHKITKPTAFLEKVEQCGRRPQQACTTMLFLIPKKDTRASRCAYAYDDSLVGSLASARSCEMATKISY